MQKYVAITIVFLFGIWLGQPAMSSLLDVNQAPFAIESAGEPDIPLEDNSSQQQAFDEEEEEKLFDLKRSAAIHDYYFLFSCNHLNPYSEISLDVLIPPPDLV